MRSVRAFLSLVLVLFASLTSFALGGVAVAQEESPEGDLNHPIVGTWILVLEEDPTGAAPSLAVFTDGGAYFEISDDGTVTAGSWESTGDNTANLTILTFLADEEGLLVGTFTVRAEVEIAEDGQSLSATYTAEFVGADGSGGGEYGPGTGTGTLVAVEPMGTPEGTLEELLEMFEGEPEATPES